ncbi:MAG TPA: hypothetical protein VF116_13635 [Ktedonobacterales bacterium]
MSERHEGRDERAEEQPSVGAHSIHPPATGTGASPSITDAAARPSAAEVPADTQARISRRRLLQVTGGAIAVGAGAAALYRGLSLIAPPTRQPIKPPPGGYPLGQYQIANYGVRVRPDPESAVQVVIPPVWNLVITATLVRSPGVREQQRLEAALRAVETAYPYSPAGVFALVAYGLPYFRRFVAPSVLAAHLPRMAGDGTTPVLIDAIRFPSDPPKTLLESNDVVFQLRSDVLDQLHDVQQALFGRGGTLAGQHAPAADIADLFHVTSVRTGFVGAGLPRRMAEQAHLAVAPRIPAAAPLFMGFTSTQELGEAKEVAVSFDGRRDPLLEPLTTAHPGDYFAGGTSLSMSHMFEDLEAWYALSYDERVARMFHLNVPTVSGRITLQTQWLNPNTTSLDAQQQHVIGHNEAVQRSSRSAEGQALQLRVDFNTMDALDGPAPATGLHFLAFTPGAQIFHQSRLSMDATDLAQQYGIAPRANGINAFLRVTRRQNFLVPPRAHRAFPLVDLTGPASR